MRTLKIVVLALGLAAFATGCGKKKDTSTPATTEPAANPCGGGGEEANPCGGDMGDPCGGDPCGNPCGGDMADPCGGGE